MSIYCCKGIDAEKIRLTQKVAPVQSLKTTAKISALYENIKLLKTDLKQTLLFSFDTIPCSIYHVRLHDWNGDLCTVWQLSLWGRYLISIMSPVHDVNWNIDLFFSLFHGLFLFFFGGEGVDLMWDCLLAHFNIPGLIRDFEVLLFDGCKHQNSFYNSLNIVISWYYNTGVSQDR